MKINANLLLISVFFIANKLLIDSTLLFYMIMITLISFCIWITIYSSEKIIKICSLLIVISIASGILDAYHLSISDYGLLIGILSDLILVYLIIRHFLVTKSSILVRICGLVIIACLTLRLLTLVQGANWILAINLTLSVGLLGLIFVYLRNQDKYKYLSHLLSVYAILASFSIAGSGI